MTGTRTSVLPKAAAAVAVGLILVAGGGGIGFWLAQHPTTQASSSPTGGKTPLYWYDPMAPDQHFDKPGKSPFMDMQLVPRYAGERQAEPGIRIDPAVAQNLGIRLATVERKPVSSTITASGLIAFNDRDVAVIQARQNGFVALSRRRAVGDIVSAGDPLIDLRVPDWTGALAEYLALKSGPDPSLAASARQRLGALGVPDGVIRDTEAKGVPPQIFTIRAPINGAIATLDVREGMTIMAGAPLATIKGISPVWLIVSVPQGVAGRVKTGGHVSARIPAFPGETLDGRIESVLPSADASSRAVEVRVALPNPAGRLRPGMTASVDLSAAEASETLLAPSEAVIRTGKRAVVITVLNDGRFAPVEVGTGASFGESIEILSGLAEGQKIVASGQFLIDSEASLSGVMARLQTKGVDGEQADFSTTGKVTAIDKTGVTLSHAPVERLNWPAMTMQFAWGKDGAPGGVKVGDEVQFSFRRDGKSYVITAISPIGQRQ
jgi:Cu(I)/Ag(I) efflux system membrane fusion protein